MLLSGCKKRDSIDSSHPQPDHREATRASNEQKNDQQTVRKRQAKKRMDATQGRDSDRWT
jgi:hypothetical protein